MKPMMQSRYVGWMAIRPLTFGGETYAPGDRVPQKHLDSMRDPEVLVRTGRLAAVAKDMNKVPRSLRKDVTGEDEMRAKILGPRIASQIGPVVPRHLVGTEHDPTSKAFKSRQKALARAEEEAREQAETAGLDDREEPLEPAPHPPLLVPSVSTDPDDIVVDAKDDGTVEITNLSRENADNDVDTPTDTPETEEDPGLDVSAGQSPAETDTTEDATEDAEAAEVDAEPVPEPAKNATTEAWVEFAKSKGVTEEDLADAKRDELIVKYGTPENTEES